MGRDSTLEEAGVNCCQQFLTCLRCSSLVSTWRRRGSFIGVSAELQGSSNVGPACNLDICRLIDYMLAMAKHHAAQIVPKDFPELGMLVWNRDDARPIEREEAFEIYELNWRHVDVEHLTPAEARLIEALTQEFGQGHLLAA